jgi:hypothetical protein
MVKRTWYGDKIKKDVSAAAARGLFVAGEVLLAEANTRVPYMDHILEESGESHSDETQCIVSYDTPYARRLHENPVDNDKPFNFMHGRQSHWLSETMAEMEDELHAIIAKGIRGELGG